MSVLLIREDVAIIVVTLLVLITELAVLDINYTQINTDAYVGGYTSCMIILYVVCIYCIHCYMHICACCGCIYATSLIATAWLQFIYIMLSSMRATTVNFKKPLYIAYSYTLLCSKYVAT